VRHVLPLVIALNVIIGAFMLITASTSAACRAAPRREGTIAMRVVVALGGNALLRRGQALTDENQSQNVALAADELTPVALEHELVISHGNGPQVGLLALQSAAYPDVPPYPLDVLGAETQGMIGYLVTRELGNRLPFEKPLAVLLTMIEVDPDDPAFANPTKPIGPFYSADDAEALAQEKGWVFRPDGDAYRRVVPSPLPKRIFELRQIRWMLEKDAIVICSGGGGIPVMYVENRQLVGVEAVIDKDFASELLADGIKADRFVMATDVDAVYVDWGLPTQRAIARAHPDALLEIADQFPDGSMRPKVVAGAQFARKSGHVALIGTLSEISEMLAGSAGTAITNEADGIEYRA
jgi:carbamate kinase